MSRAEARLRDLADDLEEAARELHYVADAVGEEPHVVGSTPIVLELYEDTPEFATYLVRLPARREPPLRLTVHGVYPDD